MSKCVPGSASPEIDYEVLAAFRQTLRKFQHESDLNAKGAQLTSQQHQALLVIKGGYPGKSALTVTELAEALMLKHHSAVELVGRLARTGFIARGRSSADRRQVMVSITPAGEAVLLSLSATNLEVLKRAAPALSDLLKMLSEHGFGPEPDRR